MLYVYPVLQRFGLGNKLVVWARAEVFAVDHHAQILKPSFVQLPSIGAMVRGERLWRTNWGDFDLDSAHYIGGLKRWRVLATYPRISEDDWTGNSSNGVVFMRGLGHDTFSILLRHHAHIHDRLRTITSRPVLRAVDELASKPFIGVHMRRGDFRRIGAMTDDAWFVEAIRKAVEIVGHLPIRVFSDGRREELDFVQRAFPSEDVIIMPSAKPLQDVWSLSKSKILVGSSGSSFSIWAVLLGQMPSIWSQERAPTAKDLYVDARLNPIIL